MTFALLTITLFGASAAAQAAPLQAGHAVQVRARHEALVHTGVAPVVAYAAPANAAGTAAPKPWMLMLGGLGAMSLAVRRRHSQL